MTMIQRNTNPFDPVEFSVALHESCHVAIAELVGFIYERIFLGEGTLPDGRTISGGLVPPQNLREIVRSADETLAESLLLKYAMVARAGQWIDTYQSGFTEDQASRRAGGDWDLFNQLFDDSVLEATRREEIRNESIVPFEGHVSHPRFLRAVNKLAAELMARRSLEPADVRRVLDANGLH